jgi:hypothetical protein
MIGVASTQIRRAFQSGGAVPFTFHLSPPSHRSAMMIRSCLGYFK